MCSNSAGLEEMCVFSDVRVSDHLLKAFEDDWFFVCVVQASGLTESHTFCGLNMGWYYSIFKFSTMQ